MAIVGYMGCGKTTVGRLLARTLGWESVDLDRAIAKETGCEIAQIFAHFGEEHFRNLEHRVLVGALDGREKRVIACGGGIVVRHENRAKLKEEATTVFLREYLGLLYDRTRAPGRPLRAASREEFERRYAERLPLYEEVADLEVPIRGRPPEVVAQEISRWLPSA